MVGTPRCGGSPLWGAGGVIANVLGKALYLIDYDHHQPKLSVRIYNEAKRKSVLHWMPQSPAGIPAQKQHPLHYGRRG